MRLLKSFLEFLVTLFFRVYFGLVGKPKFDQSFKKALSFYKQGGFSELFQTVRAWDAPFAEINKLTPKSGNIVDLGSGDGLLANYLALSSKKRSVIGIEYNPKRYRDTYNKLPNTKFLQGDVLKTAIPKANAILLIDVLHHLPTKSDQQLLLSRVKSSLKPGGLLIIAEIVRRPFYKYIYTWLVDAIAVPILFERKLIDTSFHYRNTKQWVKLLTSVGYECNVTAAHEGKPFSHIIITCK